MVQNAGKLQAAAKATPGKQAQQRPPGVDKPNLKPVAPKPSNQAGQAVIKATSDAGTVKRANKRQVLLSLSFLVLVVLPTLTSAAYLFILAKDQYHSRAGFSVRSEEFSNPLDALSAFTGISAGSVTSRDTDILFDFIQSQAIIEYLDAKLDLRQMFAAQLTGFDLVPEDFVFGLEHDASIEDLVEFWSRMVVVSRDNGSGIIDIEVRTFNPSDARRLADAILIESTNLVNELSQIAQGDAIRFALEDLEVSENALAEIRKRVRDFRNENRFINPEANVSSQSGVLAELQSLLAETLIRRGNIETYTGAGDPRIADLDRQIQVIRDQIEAERTVMVSSSGGEGPSLSDAIGTYEELLVDLEFSENAYTASLASVEQARAEARRQSRYAAIHIQPTLAEDSIFPRRWQLLFIVFVSSLSIWAVISLVYYNIRDRA